jgi:thioredoxin 1
MSERDVVVIDDTNFEREVLGSREPFLLDFTAAWCSPCKALEPVVEKLASSTQGVLRVGKIDIDDAPEISRKYGIRGAPTILVFKNGKEAARHVGVTTEKRLRELAGIER